MTYEVGVMGLGVIGKPFAERHVAAGHRLAIHDVRPEPLAELAQAFARACACGGKLAATASRALQVWEDLGPRWKKMLAPAAPGAALPHLREDLHRALEAAHVLGVPLFLGAQAASIADAGIATGHHNATL